MRLEQATFRKEEAGKNFKKSLQGRNNLLKQAIAKERKPTKGKQISQYDSPRTGMMKLQAKSKLNRQTTKVRTVMVAILDSRNRLSKKAG